MTVIDGVFSLGRGCYKETRDTFQSLCLAGVRLWDVITLQTLWWEISGRSGSWNKTVFVSIDRLQWCSPRDQSLGLRAPRRQNIKSWSWSWQKSLKNLKVGNYH